MKSYYFLFFLLFFSKCYAFEALASLRSSVETNSSKIERKYFNYYENILIKIAKSNGFNNFNYSDISIEFVCNGGCYNKKEPFLLNFTNKNNYDEEKINELFTLLEKILNVKLSWEQKKSFFEACRNKNDRFYLKIKKFDLWFDFSDNHEKNSCNFNGYIAKNFDDNNFIFMKRN